MKYSVVTCFSSPPVAFKNSLTTRPGGVVFIWITLQLCFALVSPGGVLEFFARTPGGVACIYVLLT